MPLEHLFSNTENLHQYKKGSEIRFENPETPLNALIFPKKSDFSIRSNILVIADLVKILKRNYLDKIKKVIVLHPKLIFCPIGKFTWVSKTFGSDQFFMKLHLIYPPNPPLKNRFSNREQSSIEREREVWGVWGE